MRGTATLLTVLFALLLPPTAGAWGARVAHEVAGGLAVDETLLLAGRLDAASTGGAPFALARAETISFGGPAAVRVCPDRAGEPDPDCAATPATLVPGARLVVHAGGVVVQPLQEGRAALAAGPAPALLGGAAVVLNRVPTGPALFAAGAAAIRAEGDAFLLRPLGADASVEVRAAQGGRHLHGEGFTLRVTGASGASLEGEGAILSLREGDEVLLSRAGAGEAEAALRVEGLLDLQRRVLPPGHAPRRADVAAAFGPFEAVPALLDGALAAHANLTLGGAPQEGFRLLRVEHATLRLAQGRWEGEAEASYLVEGDVLAARPGARVDPPLLVPLLLAGVALAARLLSAREAASPARRRLAWALRLGGLLLLALLADLLAASLLGVHPLLDGEGLSGRSRAQLALLAVGMALAAYAMVGLAVQSLARTAFATRGRPDAALVPAALGLAAAGAMLLVGHAPLLSLVARLVRL